MMNAPTTHMSSARWIVPSLEEEEGQEEEWEEEEVDDDEDDIHPGKKLSLRLLYFTSSSLECRVPVVAVVGSNSLALSRDDDS